MNTPTDCAVCNNYIAAGSSVVEVKIVFGNMNNMIVATDHPGGKYAHLHCLRLP